jgi:sugar phosphate isomerase/epimerase
MPKQYNVKFAYNTLVYAGEDITESIRRLARYKYDGVEIVGEPKKMNINLIKEELKKNNIAASSILAIYNCERDIVSSNAKIRRDAIDYIKENVDFAKEVDAKIVTISPTACMKIHPEASLDQEWKWAVEGIHEAGLYAKDFNVNLVIEPWNRYETYLANRLDQVMKMVDDIGLQNVGAMCDTFHMNIEEKNIADAIRKAKGYLKHIHIADSTRQAPGYGHIDFKVVAQAIKDIGYHGYLSMELLPAAADPFMVLNGSRQDEFYDQYTRDSIEFLRPLFR